MVTVSRRASTLVLLTSSHTSLEPALDLGFQLPPRYSIWVKTNLEDSPMPRQRPPEADSPKTQQPAPSVKPRNSLRLISLSLASARLRRISLSCQRPP